MNRITTMYITYAVIWFWSVIIEISVQLSQTICEQILSENSTDRYVIYSSSADNIFYQRSKQIVTSFRVYFFLTSFLFCKQIQVHVLSTWFVHSFPSLSAIKYRANKQKHWTFFAMWRKIFRSKIQESRGKFIPNRNWQSASYHGKLTKVLQS